jgi:hypothetical protein
MAPGWRSSLEIFLTPYRSAWSSKFTAFGNLSLTLMLGMFMGGIPEAAASASMLTKAGYRPGAIFGLWSTVLVAGVVAAAAGKAFIGSSDALMALCPGWRGVPCWRWSPMP